MDIEKWKCFVTLLVIGSGGNGVLSGWGIGEGAKFMSHN